MTGPGQRRPAGVKRSTTTRRTSGESAAADSPLGARWDSLVRGRHDEQAVYRTFEQARALAAPVREARAPS